MAIEPFHRGSSTLFFGTTCIPDSHLFQSWRRGAKVIIYPYFGTVGLSSLKCFPNNREVIFKTDLESKQSSVFSGQKLLKGKNKWSTLIVCIETSLCFGGWQRKWSVLICSVYYGPSLPAFFFWQKRDEKNFWFSSCLSLKKRMLQQIKYKRHVWFWNLGKIRSLDYL